MDLTDEQWALIQPLLTNIEYPISNCSHGEDEDPAQLSNPISPQSMSVSRGRPPADPRATLNGILRKIRLAAPWYDLPPYTSALHPSWQTCYLSLSRTPCGSAIATGTPLVSWTTSTACSTRTCVIVVESTC